MIKRRQTRKKNANKRDSDTQMFNLGISGICHMCVKIFIIYYSK